MKIHLPVFPPPLTPPPPPKPAAPTAWMMEQMAHEESERLKLQRRAQKIIRSAARKNPRNAEDFGDERAIFTGGRLGHYRVKA